MVVADNTLSGLQKVHGDPGEVVAGSKEALIVGNVGATFCLQQ